MSILYLYCYIALINIVFVYGRIVNVNVVAPWDNYRHSSKLAFSSEISEFLFDISPTLFWNYTDKICEYNFDIPSVRDEGRSISDDDHQASVFDIGTSLVPQSLQSLMFTMIGLGHYSPAIQFFESLASRYDTSDHGYPCGVGQAFMVLSPGDSVSCTLDDLVNDYNILIAANSNDHSRNSIDKHQDWEHIYQPSSNINNVIDDKDTELLGKFQSTMLSTNTDIDITLYGTIGSTSFCSLHRVLSLASNRGLFQTYTFRHSTARHSRDSSDSTMSSSTTIKNNTANSNAISMTPLQGYGIFLDIKNMEYKNVDDSKEKDSSNSNDVKNQNEETVIDFSNTDEILGLNFSTLYRNLPQLGPELVTLKDELLKLETEASEQSSSTSLKVWKMHDLGLQTLSIIQSAAMSGTVADGMHKFTEIVQNFPRFASKVSSAKVLGTVRSELSRYLESGLSHQIPSNSMFINGKRTDLSASTFNLFDLLADIRSELKILSKLSSLPLSRDAKKKITSVANNFSPSPKDRVGGGGSSLNSVRIDVSKGGKYVVNFLNNLEKDPVYRGMPRSLKQLLLPSWQLASVARNLYTLIALVDLFSEGGASLLMQIYMLMQQQYPVRIGIVFSCTNTGGTGVKSSDGSDSDSSNNEDFCRLYAYLKKEYSNDDATNFALSIASALMEGIQTGSATAFGLMSRIELISIFDSIRENSYKTSVSTLNSGISVITTKMHSDFISNCTAYIEARGLPINSYSLNGIVNTDGHLSNALMQLLSSEQQHVTQLYRSKVITDKTKSLFSAILEHAGAFSRYHPMLDEKSPEYIDFLSNEGITLLEKLNFIDLSFSEDDSYNELILPVTTIIYTPITIQGFTVIYRALQWLQATEVFGHRLAIVFQETLHNGQSVTCNVSTEETCSAIDPQSIAISSHISAVLTMIQNLLSDPISNPNLTADDSSYERHHCGLFCTNILTKIYAFLAEQTQFPLSYIEEFKHIIADYIIKEAKSESEVSKLEKIKDALSHNSEITPSEIKILTRLGSLVFKQALSSTSDSNPSNEMGMSLPIIVHSGRVLKIESKETAVHQEDFILLANLEKSRISDQTSAITQALFIKNTNSSTSSLSDDKSHSTYHQYNHYSNLMLKISSYCGSYSSLSSAKRFDIQRLVDTIIEDAPSMVYHLEPPATSFALGMEDLQIYFIVDPLSLAGQRASSLIHLFREHLQYSQTIILVPKLDITEFPLQNFYRFVASPSLNDDEDDNHHHNNNVLTARFTQLPLQHTLTVRVDIPEPWNVQAFSALQDIDNLRCSATVCGDAVRSSDSNNKQRDDVTSVSYALKNILVAGQCFEANRHDPSSSSSRYNAPPNGLQLTLSPLEISSRDDNTHQSDTLVMQNLGYFQLKANPGLFRLGLADGRASDLFEMLTGESSVIPVRTYEDTIHRIKVLKKLGMESVPLLATPEDEDDSAATGRSSNGIWNSISSLLSSKTDQAILKKDVEEDDRIHVFSLATGHMYERLLRIMMLSVYRHSSKPLKFWLFENYLSPTFKQTATMMSEEYGFEVGYVTYKWPQWLTQQTQQQRIIWGYKILFLDVLFPLSVKKVIYVDADQVVRADLKELWDMDLEGKPYAYTPFCTSRKETLGFQFWQQGYWKDHLRGKPYHISALYVVDLQRFRRNAVGDTLRATYDQLSRDPNSLANLDQDLPNFAQHQVPIFSLPQEWLWCETWCSDKSKKRKILYSLLAKTIDLCNNPLHKEPKLDMARRVIEGKLFNQSWIELDEEIKNLQIKKGVTSLSNDL